MEQIHYKYKRPFSIALLVITRGHHNRFPEDMILMDSQVETGWCKKPTFSQSIFVPWIGAESACTDLHPSSKDPIYISLTQLYPHDIPKWTTSSHRRNDLFPGGWKRLESEGISAPALWLGQSVTFPHERAGMLKVTNFRASRDLHHSSRSNSKFSEDPDFADTDTIRRLTMIPPAVSRGLFKSSVRGKIKVPVVSLFTAGLLLSQLIAAGRATGEFGMKGFQGANFDHRSSFKIM